MSTKACRTPSTPTTARATARKRPTTAGSACSPGSRRTGWPEHSSDKERAPSGALFSCWTSSICVLPRLFDYRPPLRDFGLEELVQGFRLRAIRAHRLRAEPREVGLEVRVLDRVLQRSVQAVHHWLRRALGHIQSVPDYDLESLQALFIEGGNAGQRRHALLAGDSVHLHLAALDLAGGVGGLVAHEIDLPAQQIV